MYRVAKKTTQRTVYKCLNCTYCKRIDAKVEPWGCYVECTAENKCFLKQFNARDYYCIQYKGSNELSKIEKEKIRNKVQEDYAKKELKKYLKTYYTKQEAEAIMADRRRRGAS